MSDIVGQMTREMNLTGDMLDAMQQQQMQPGGGMPQQGGSGMDFSQMSPQQQMQMMDAMNQQTQQPQQPQMPPAPQYESETESESESEDSDSESELSMAGQRAMNKLGLGNSGALGAMGWGDSIVHYLKDPIIVMVLFILLSLTQFDTVLKPILPSLVNTGLYYIGIKGLGAALMFFLIKLVIV